MLNDDNKDKLKNQILNDITDISKEIHEIPN